MSLEGCREPPEPDGILNFFGTSGCRTPTSCGGGGTNILDQRGRVTDDAVAYGASRVP